MININQGKIAINETLVLSIDLHINRKDFCLVVGPNGCGKTTLFDAIIGYKCLNSGSLLKGTSKPIGYAVQDVNNALLPWLKIYQNIMLPALREPSKEQKEIKNKTDIFLAEFNLAERINDFPYNLSGGEKQIVNFIRTISTPGDLFLFDEVFASFHKDSIEKAKNIILGNLKGRTILFISHTINDLDLPFNRYFTFYENHITEISRQATEKILLSINEEN